MDANGRDTDVTFEIDSCIRGYHQYQEIWSPILGEVLSAQERWIIDMTHFVSKLRKKGLV